MPDKWAPIITDDTLRNKVWTSIHNIKDALINHSYNLDTLSLFAGHSGVLLFLYEYYKATGQKSILGNIFKILDSLYTEIEYSTHGYSFSLANGLAGVGWLINYISQDGIIEIDADEFLDHIDSLLYTKMVFDLKRSNYDYLHGGGGAALYYLSRKSNKVDVYVRSFFSELASLALINKHSGEVRWADFDHKKQISIPSSFNLSLAHGIPSIVIMLTKLTEYHANLNERDYLIKGGVNYLLANKIKIRNSKSIFSWTVNEIAPSNANSSPSRLAWCYGDLGVALSVFKAGLTLSDDELLQKSINIFLHSTLRKDLKENMLFDSTLCHGTTGLLHFYNVIYQNTGNKSFKSAALFWLEKTLQFSLDPQGKYIDFQTWDVEDKSMKNDYSFLTGMPGIGLALLAGLSDRFPKWDEILLLS